MVLLKNVANTGDKNCLQMHDIAGGDERQTSTFIEAYL
jgi:hypothetical protein